MRLPSLIPDHETNIPGEPPTLFESDIVLNSEDKKYVDTSQTGDAESADVKVGGILEKRKAIRNRRNLWPTRTIPIQVSTKLGGY